MLSPRCQRSRGDAKVRQIVSSPKMAIPVRSVRPSLGDCRFTGDACVIDQGDGLLDVRLGDYILVQVAGSPFDVPSLNQVFERIRHAFARRGR
jgi:hypothetical protein